MPHWKELCRGPHISALEFDGKDVTITITAVNRISLESLGGIDKADRETGDKKGAKKECGEVHFKGSDRTWIVRTTNLQALAALFGTDHTKWAGHKVTIHSVMVKLGGKEVPGIRVKGSPELKQIVTYTEELAMKRPRPVKLYPTGGTATETIPAAMTGQSEPPADDMPPLDSFSVPAEEAAQ